MSVDDQVPSATVAVTDVADSSTLNAGSVLPPIEAKSVSADPTVAAADEPVITGIKRTIDESKQDSDNVKDKDAGDAGEDSWEIIDGEKELLEGSAEKKVKVDDDGAAAAAEQGEVETATAAEGTSKISSENKVEVGEASVEEPKAAVAHETSAELEQEDSSKPVEETTTETTSLDNVPESESATVTDPTAASTESEPATAAA